MWSLLNKEENKTAILKTGVTQKYICTIDSDIQIGTMNVVTTTECRWVVTVKQITEQGYRLEILTLDNHIIATNNPSVHDVAALNNLFKEIYNELDVTVNKKGHVYAINNLVQIKDKWLRVRGQLKTLTANEESIASVIRLNDDIFDNNANLMHTIRAIEFFEIFFNGIYEESIPYSSRVTRKSKFQAADIDWAIRYSYENNDNKTVVFEGENEKRLNADWLRNAYGHFTFLEPATLVPVIGCKGKYQIDPETGMVVKASYYTEEVVHVQLLYNKIKYTLTQY